MPRRDRHTPKRASRAKRRAAAVKAAKRLEAKGDTISAADVRSAQWRGRRRG